MAIDRNDTDERQARVEHMIQEFRDAQQRQLVRRGMALWALAEAAHRASAQAPSAKTTLTRRRSNTAT